MNLKQEGCWELQASLNYKDENWRENQLYGEVFQEEKVLEKQTLKKRWFLGEELRGYKKMQSGCWAVK